MTWNSKAVPSSRPPPYEPPGVDRDWVHHRLATDSIPCVPDRALGLHGRRECDTLKNTPTSVRRDLSAVPGSSWLRTRRVLTLTARRTEVAPLRTCETRLSF